MLIGLSALVMRRTQAPAAAAGEARQAALEDMSHNLASGLSERLDRAGAGIRFRDADPCSAPRRASGTARGVQPLRLGAWRTWDR